MSDPNIPTPPWWAQLAAPAGIIATALLARALVHWRLVQLGRRHLLSWSLIWELPTAILCAIFGAGLAEWWALDGSAALAVVGVVSWMGPRGLEDVLARIIAHHYPGGGAAGGGR